MHKMYNIVLKKVTCCGTRGIKNTAQDAVENNDFVLSLITPP